MKAYVSAGVVVVLVVVMVVVVTKETVVNENAKVESKAVVLFRLQS